MSDSISDDPNQHVFYFVFYLPGIESCTLRMLKHCLTCLRRREDVKVFTSMEEWDGQGQGARVGEVALEIVTAHDDIDMACAKAKLHVEKLIWSWASLGEPCSDGFYVVVYATDPDGNGKDEVQEQDADDVDADLEACAQSFRLVELRAFSEQLDAAVAALDGFSMREE